MAADPIAIAPDPELAQLIDDFLASQLSPRTRESYAGDLVIFLRWLGERGTHPREVARPDVDRYRNWLAEPIGPDGKPASNGRPRYAPATVARKLSAVRAFYNYLSERRVIPGSPAAGVKGPRLRREPRGRAITDEQVRRLLATATERAVLQTIGARTQGPVFRRQDGRRLRAGSPAPRVPYNRQAVYRLLAELAGHAGLVGDEDGQVEGLSPHKLRHTFVTMLLDRGVPLVAVQDAARHSSSDTTRLYDRARAAWREHPTHKLDF